MVIKSWYVKKLFVRLVCQKNHFLNPWYVKKISPFFFSPPVPNEIPPDRTDLKLKAENNGSSPRGERERIESGCLAQPSTYVH
jgi:hypothetical protein